MVSSYMTQRLTLAEMKQIASALGGECLSDKYVNTGTKLLWRCRVGHEWKGTPHHVKGGHWCPQCSYKKRGELLKDTIEQMQNIALNKGGECLSDKYVNSEEKLKWKCENGHIWEATPHSVKSGSWCWRCYGTFPLTLAEMHDIAKERGGKCLSTEYVNSTSNLLWECKEGHKWEAVPGSIKSGSWCRRCAGLEKLTIEDMHTLAKNRGGLCLSTEYMSSQTKLRWQCANGHVFFTTPSHIKTSGSWCRTCDYESKRIKFGLGLSKMNEVAAFHGGKCLSTEYKNTRSKLLWECKEGHQWHTSASSILSGKSWCPACSSLINEAIIRAIFEKIFNAHFPKVRPKWLMGSSGYPLELDGYNEELKIAFEYHGEQHFKKNYFTNLKKNSDLAFDKQQLDDSIKRNVCLDNGVTLIEIPYTIKASEYVNYIFESCNKKNIKLKNDSFFDYKILSISTRTKIQELKDVASSRGGKCLSETYLGYTHKLLWQCGSGHTWEATPASIYKSGHPSWCPYCSGSKNLNIELMKKIAAEKNGECLSENYKNVETKLLWQCQKGHKWMATPHMIRNGTWCPHCAGKARLTIEKMHEVASSKGGVCLSSKYIDNKTKLLWQCKFGHVWKALPSSVKHSSWCPRCKRTGGISMKNIVSNLNLTMFES